MRASGDWETWLEFFLNGVKTTAEQAVNAARQILALLEEDRRQIEALGRPAASALKVFQYAQTSPILSIGAAAEKTGITFPTVTSAVEHLRRLGVLREITGKRRKRLFIYGRYMAILNEGMDAPPG